MTYLTFIVGFGIGYFTGLYIKGKEFKATFSDPIEPEQTFTIGQGFETVSNTHTQFIESVSAKEKFTNARNVSDLIDN